MRKLKCIVRGRKGYVVLDDDKSYLGTINLSGRKETKYKWFWQSSNVNGRGWSRDLSEAIDRMKFYKFSLPEEKHEEIY